MELLHNSGEIISQRYCILGILGQGSSGTTYLAKNLESDEKVALKALSLSRVSDWKMLELFEREAKVLEQLNHSGIPHYIEYFHTDSAEDRSFYIAQQLAEGKSLGALIEDGYRTQEQEVKQIAAKILEILIYLHKQEPPVIHRDIKPQNIIFQNLENIFLVDFGAVQNAYYTTFMRGSTVVGTYGYMAPEQFRGQAEPATDLYSLGATLLFLLTHRSPADLPNDGLKIDFRSRVNVSEAFADWLEKMLEPDVDERFKSAEDALQNLQNLDNTVKESKKAVKLNTIVKVGFACFAIPAIIGFANYYKWGILNILGFAPPKAICNNITAVRSYLEQTNNPNAFINSPAELDKYLQYKPSLLSCAVLERNRDVVELLLAKGADINLRHYHDKTVLHLLLESINGHDYSYYKQPNEAQRQNIEMLQLLIKHGADVNAQDKYGKSPLHIQFGMWDDEIYFKILNILVKGGANVNIKNQFGSTPLHVLLNGHSNYIQSRELIEAVKLLINYGADVNAKEKTNKTPLHMIMSRDSENRKLVAQLLIDKNADVNAKDEAGITPLHIIIGRKFNETKPVIELLLNRGADINVKNNSGNTPLAYIKKFNTADKQRVIAFLKQNGAKE
jgi:ankyrin repeat protein